MKIACLALLFFCLALLCRFFSINAYNDAQNAKRNNEFSKSFENVSSKIILYERFDLSDIKSHSAAIDRCCRFMDENGYKLEKNSLVQELGGSAYLTVFGVKENK